MLKLLIFIILINSSYCFQNSFINDMTPNDYLLNRTFNQQYMNLKRDQSQFDDVLCREQLNSFVKGLTNQDDWALKSEFNVPNCIETNEKIMCFF